MVYPIGQTIVPEYLSRSSYLGSHNTMKLQQMNFRSSPNARAEQAKAESASGARSQPPEAETADAMQLTTLASLVSPAVTDLAVLQRLAGNRAVTAMLTELRTPRNPTQRHPESRQADASMISSAPIADISRTPAAASTAPPLAAATSTMHEPKVSACVQRSTVDARTPSDVKGITNFAGIDDTERLRLMNIVLNQFWVGPHDESALQRIWNSFDEDGLVHFIEAHPGKWEECIDRGAELTNIRGYRDIQAHFRQDITALARHYLQINENVVNRELDALGSGDAPPGPDQAARIAGLQAAAASLTKLAACSGSRPAGTGRLANRRRGRRRSRLDRSPSQVPGAVPAG